MCFGCCGFVVMLFNDIVCEVGVSKLLFYYYFDFKEYLFLESQLMLFWMLLVQFKVVMVGDKRGVLNFNVVLGQVMDFVEMYLDQICVVLMFRNVVYEYSEVQVYLDCFNVEFNEFVIIVIYNMLGAYVECLVLFLERLAWLLVMVFNGFIVDLVFVSMV